MKKLPHAAAPFLDFTTRLRNAGFAIAPDQSTLFLEAVGLLGPRSMRDIHRAARATLAPPPDRFAEFDALFRAVFLGQTLAAVTDGDDVDEVEAFDQRDGDDEILEAEDVNESGQIASGAEVLTRRRFPARSPEAALAHLARHGARSLPRRRTLRRQRDRHGDRWDLRRMLSEAARNDGEFLAIRSRKRKARQRRSVLLIDVSGSMKEQTASSLDFAHTLCQISDHLEVFTLGTRLTRVSRSLSHRDRSRALVATETLVADWDGGTRLGDALLAFLDVPRFAGFTRSALVLVLSDGLERGDSSALTAAVRRLSRLAWHLAWLTPLAADPEYAPKTEALTQLMPFLDDFAEGSDTDSLCRYITSFGSMQ